MGKMESKQLLNEGGKMINEILNNIEAYDFYLGILVATLLFTAIVIWKFKL